MPGRMIPLRHDIENSPLFHMVDPETVDVAGDPYVSMWLMSTQNSFPE